MQVIQPIKNLSKPDVGMEIKFIIFMKEFKWWNLTVGNLQLCFS